MNVRRLGPVLAFTILVSCSGDPTPATVEITETRAHPVAGMEFDLRVENPLDEAAEAECSVNGPNNRGVTIATHLPASGEKTLTTRMPDLPEDTSADEFDVNCTVEI